MKKIILLITISLTLLSCTNFIEQDLRGTQNLDNYFKTQEECTNFVNDLYKSAFMHNIDWYKLLSSRLANETATDDAWVGNTGQNNINFIPAAQYLITPNRMGYLQDVYMYRYQNLMACNIAIYSIENAPISDALKTQYIGESLFLRAYNYYELVNNFGGIPLVLNPLDPDHLNLEKESKENVYAQIEKDLISAASKLKTITDQGRATKWACYGLLARVSLFQDKWDKAYHYADTLIKNSHHSLEPNFINIWNVNNPNGVESIIEAQTSSNAEKALGSMLCTFAGARGEKSENFPSNKSEDVMDGWGWCTPTSDLENCYLSENDDIRRKSTITVNGDPAYGDEVLNPTHIFDLEQNKSGRVIRKYYIPIATRRELKNKQNNAPLNTPIIRLAEIYLTRAEAAYHLNNSSQAMDDVDFIRARVNLTPKKGKVAGNDILYAIWKERRMELAFEGIRLYDIRRQIDPETNKPVIDKLFGPNGSFVIYNTRQSTDKYETTNKKELQDKGINFDLNKHLVWPIPQAEIDRSNGKVKQNPNY